MPGFAKDAQDFFSACERLLSRTRLARLSDDEDILVNHYINELSDRYGARNEGIDGCAQPGSVIPG
jgi:hypothetical protein